MVAAPLPTRHPPPLLLLPAYRRMDASAGGGPAPPPPHRPSAGREPGGVEGMAGTTLPRLPAFFSARASLRVRGGAGAGGMWMAWV